MTRTKISIFITILMAMALPAFSQRLGFEDYGDLAIDFPVGFQLVESNQQGTAFQLQSIVVPANAIVRIYEKGRFETPKAALDSSLKALSAKSDTEEFSWRNQEAAISSFTAKINRQSVTGYGLSVAIPENRGTVVLLSWSLANQLEYCNSYMLSLLDSLIIDEGSLYEAGPITSYLYPRSSEKIDVNLNIDGKKIKTNLRANDQEAAQYLIEREYEVLKIYANAPNWKEALQRYYRMIFRDSYGRLWQAGFDIFNELYIDSQDDTDLAQKLLTWTQGFNYEREKTESDFASLPSILLGGGSDCDSRSMLLSVLLTQMNQDAIMIVSAKFSHAMAAITSDHPGHSFTFDNKNYLMGETTSAGLTWGKIDSTQDDQSKWMAVFF